MNSRAHRPDHWLTLSVAALLAVGMIMIYSLSPILSSTIGEGSNFFLKQVFSLVLGIAAWVWASSVGYENWRHWAKYLLAAAVIGMFAILIPGIGVARNGATRWLNLGPLSFQPAELLKPALVLYLAGWLEKQRDNIRTIWDGLVPFAVIMGAISLVIVVFQRDMGTMAVIAMAGILMYFVAGMRWSDFGIVMVGAAVFATLAVVAFSHRLARITAFLDPSKDTSGLSYHINQALIAIGSGGLFGVGLGRSVQVYGYLPEAANDSIFAVIAEEFGLVGSAIVIGLLGIVVYRGFKIARSAPDSFGRLVASGITLWIMFQAIINIMAMLSLMPLTGIPLPFISFGGTNLVITLLAVGILHNISKYTTEEAYEGTGIRRGHGWTRFANPGDGRRPKAAR